MVVKELITDGDRLVNTKLFDVKANLGIASAIRQDLTDTLETLEDRLFLCSNEIGREERAIALKFSDKTMVIFNPAFTNRERIFINREKDIKTGNEYFVPRFAGVSVAYTDEDGNLKGFKLNEVASVVMCQAMNVLDGIFASDVGLEVLPGFDDMTEEEKQEILANYLESLKTASEQADEELTKDEETHDQWSAAKFIQGVADGTIKLDKDPPSNNEKKRWKKFFKSLKNNENRNKFWKKIGRKK